MHAHLLLLFQRDSQRVCRYEKVDTALITGSMLREALKQPEFAKCAAPTHACAACV